jgi:hypothetical protein
MDIVVATYRFDEYYHHITSSLGLVIRLSIALLTVIGNKKITTTYINFKKIL